MTKQYNCDVCGKVIDEDDEIHFYHDEDCPYLANLCDTIDCECDLVAHSACCPMCNPTTADRITGDG
jgi:hypothetical protein